MSYQDKIKNNIRITTGDGKIYEPLSLVTSNTKSFEYNISEFNFPEVAGTKVDRRLHKGTRYPLEFYFQGDDNIDQSEAFELSAKDTRPWVVLHPIYGQFTCHPLSIEFDNSGIVTTKITVTVVETITDDGPRTSFDAKENALASASEAVESIGDYGGDITPDVSDVVDMQENVNQIYNESLSDISDEQTSTNYFNLYKKSVSATNNALTDFSNGILTITEFLVFPSLFPIGVKFRLDLIKKQAEFLANKLSEITTVSKKQIFETQKGAVVCAAIQSALTPIENDYQNAVDVLSAMELVLQIHNDFVTELNELQTPDGTQEDSYLPNAEFMFNLSYSVDYAVSNLLQIALQAQQERIIYLDSDSNPILLTHRFYGIDQAQVNVQRLIDTNKITMRELIQIPKGRKIIYYV
jgi:prophage DNA circulation protein